MARLIRRVTEIFEQDDPDAVAESLVDDAALADAGEADGEALDELELGEGGQPSDEEPEERLPRSRKLAGPRSVRRR